MFADLHLHTRFSDGTYSPEELTDEGRRYGFRALALTDHDTVEGCARMAAACRAHGIEFIAGSELTAESGPFELHILGYFLDTQNTVLLDQMSRFQAVRQNRIREMVARLNRLKIPLAEEEVFALANCQSPGRPHVARALVQAGFCSSPDEAFERFLKKHRPAWVPKAKMSASTAIGLIQQAGGVAVLAHPGISQGSEVMTELLAAGLDGIECFHTRHTPSTAEFYQRIAQKHGLLITGGSDCHGMSKGRPLIGSIRLPYFYVEQLRQRHEERVSSRRAAEPGSVARST